MIANDGHVAASGIDIAQFLSASDEGSLENLTAVEWFVARALELGLPAVAVAFGAGNYDKSVDVMVLDYYRQQLDLKHALKWVALAPDFCKQIHPLISVLPKIPGIDSLGEMVSDIQFHGFSKAFGLHKPDPFIKFSLWFKKAVQTIPGGKGTLFDVLGVFCNTRQEQIREWLAATPEIHESWRDVLGITGATTIANVERTYKRLAMKCHPDRGGSDAQMQRLNTARDEAYREFEIARAGIHA
jgi:DnaJ-class molecular chaperone with C-terminal Zn finger domain